MKNKRIKQLNRVYRKSLKILSNQLFVDKNTIILLSIEQLKYIRDLLAITALDKNEVALATLSAAIAEFEAYNNKDSKDVYKKFHWENFCELYKQNMEEWLSLNDSI